MYYSVIAAVRADGEHGAAAVRAAFLRCAKKRAAGQREARHRVLPIGVVRKCPAWTGARI